MSFASSAAHIHGTAASCYGKSEVREEASEEEEDDGDGEIVFGAGPSTSPLSDTVPLVNIDITVRKNRNYYRNFLLNTYGLFPYDPSLRNISLHTKRFTEYFRNCLAYP